MVKGGRNGLEYFISENTVEEPEEELIDDEEWWKYGPNAWGNEEH